MPPVTELILPIVCILIMVCLLFFYKGKASLPSLLTTVGIAGTFLGIVIGLWHLDTANVAASVPGLIQGIKFAAISSFVGMGLAVIVKMFQEAKTGSNQVTGATADDLLSELKKLSEISHAQNESLTGIQKSISGDEDSTLLTQVQKLRTSFNDKQDELKKSFDSFADKVAEDNSKALIDALREVIRDFNQKITEQFGDNFKQLNLAVGKLLEWQDNYREHMERMHLLYEQNLRGMKASQESLESVASQTKTILNVSKQLEEILTSYDEHRKALAQNLEAFSDIAKEAKQAFPVIEDNIENLTKTFTEKVQKSLEESEKMVDSQQKLLQNIISSLDEISENAKSHTDKVLTATDKQVTEMLDELSRSIQKSTNQTTERLEKQVVALDEALEKELTQSLATLGNQMASLSNKFVSDYTPLTERLREVVRLSEASNN